MPLLRLNRASSLDKHCNVYSHLFTREYSTCANHKRVHHVVGTLIIKGNYTFKKSWSKISKKHIACDGKYAFFDNYQNCHACFSPKQNAKETQKFSLTKEGFGKIEDALIMEAMPKSVESRHQGYKGCLLALTVNNILLRIDLETGSVIEKVYIGPTSIKHRKIQWNVCDETFTIYSTHFPRQPIHFLRQAGMEVTDVIQLTVMSIMPLEFMCKFAVTRQIFGKDVVDAVIFLDTLMVMHSTSYVRMYSMETVHEMGTLHYQKLYDKLEDGLSYGVYPAPLTINIKLEDRPPCLFEVRCQNRDVMLTMPPCYYVMWPYGETKGYCCYSFLTEQKVENGCLVAEESSIEERVSLHADDSGRIVHMKNSELRLFKVQSKADHTDPCLVEDFTIDFSTKPQDLIPKISQSGRIIKQTARLNSQEIGEKTVLSLQYCEDLDMILVISTNQDASFPVAGFYDNWDGRLLRQFELEEAMEETLERSVCFYLDTITHVFKTYQNKFECHVYKLCGMMDVADEWKEGTKKKRRRRKTSQEERESVGMEEFAPNRRRRR